MLTNKQFYKSESAALINAIHRCHAEKNKQYADYGGRGITVCDEWRGPDGFDNFIAHIGPKPCASLTLDRIDNDKGYQPGNVRWTNRKTQQANRRAPTRTKKPRAQKVPARNPPRRHNITYQGTTKALTEWAAHTGLSADAIRWRLSHGHTVEDALNPNRMKPGPRGW